MKLNSICFVNLRSKRERDRERERVFACSLARLLIAIVVAVAVFNILVVVREGVNDRAKIFIFKENIKGKK